MRFAKISITKKGVHLTRETKDAAGAVESVDLESPERPLPEFVDALQAFKAFVIDLMPFALTEEQTTVTTLNLSEDKNGLRGLIVTAIVPVPKAYDKPVVINSPLVREGGEDPSPDACILTDEMLELVGLVESEAARYVNGERIQGELFAKKDREAEPTSENVKDFDERAAHAEVSSTRKPRRGKNGKKNAATGGTHGVDFTANPDATDPPPDDAGLRQLLLSVERDVAVDAIAQWTSSERNTAQRWAEDRQKELIGQLKGDYSLAEPEHVIRASSPDLAAGWNDPKPPRLDDNAVDEIHASIEHGDD
jgi:hypothetical protein